MNKSTAKKFVYEQGFMWSDAMLIVATAIPNGMSKVNPNIEQIKVQEMMIGALEGIQEDFDYNLVSNASTRMIAINILREFK